MTEELRREIEAILTAVQEASDLLLDATVHAHEVVEQAADTVRRTGPLLARGSVLLSQMRPRRESDRLGSWQVLRLRLARMQWTLSRSGIGLARCGSELGRVRDLLRQVESLIE